MKSEERHQLLTNDLGVVTTKTVGFFEQHAASMISAVCGVLLLAAVVFWWTRTSTSENAAGWTMLDSAQGLEGLETVVDKYKGKPPGQWAQLQVAEKTLQTAMPLMFSNREIALTDLKRCREGFESLLQDKTVAPTIRERALWGLALSLETACDGDTSKAVEAYERLISDFPDSIFKTVAEDRIAALKKGDAADFYAWFSKENPKPQDIQPRDFKNGVHLPAPAGGDDNDDDFMPKEPVKTPASPEKSKDATPATEEKSDEAKKPAEKPATETPAKPAEGEKPPAADSPKDGEKPKDSEKPSEKN